MEASLTYPLEELSQGDSWALFEQRAFAKGGAKGNDKLKPIGERMVKRCGGLPLAIKMLGGLLSSIKSEDEWLKIDKSPIWEQTDVLPSLRLSYDHLPSSSLKKCFSFCSMFPEDYKIVKDELIRRWMALGLLYPPEGSVFSMEEVGGKYYDTLLWNSFLQNAEKDEFGNITSCKMHDLVHALAVSLSKNYCKTLSDDEVIADHSQVLHLWYKGKIPKTLSSNFDRLQTLVMKVGLPNNILGNLKCLRVLVFKGWKVKELPSSIGKLKHLRLLDISYADIQTLPDSVTKLYNLQTLHVYCLHALPKNFGNMISLRHFCIGSIRVCRHCRFSRIGQLTSLRTLSLFVVNGDEVCHIEDLGHLSNLQGDLNIHGLEHVRSKTESEKAKLSSKTNINTLSLTWNNKSLKEEEECNDEQVLNGLQPNLNLRSLKIEGFQGKNFASWMMPTQLHNLVKISIINCERCKQIPTLGHLAHLKYLKIRGLKNVTRIGTEFYSHDSGSTSSGSSTMSEVIFFPALRKFSIHGMEKLQEWSEPECSLKKVFPCLEELIIEDCDNLIMVPSHLPSLGRLTIVNVNKSFISVGVDFEAKLKVLLENNTKSLRKLIIGECDYLCYFPWLQKFVALERLVLKRCNNLVSLPDELYSLTSLEEMEIHGCENLKNVPAITSLRRLSISHCSSLTTLPSGMELCTSLERLQIRECRSLELLQCLLPKLKHLEIGPFFDDHDYFPWLLPDVAKNTFVSIVQHLVLLMGSGDKNLPEKLRHFSAVKRLEIHGSENRDLETLPEWIGDLSYLQSLKLVNCRKLIYFPSVEAMSRLKNLMYVSVIYCPLMKERLTEGERPEWCKIANISEIKIK